MRLLKAAAILILILCSSCSIPRDEGIFYIRIYMLADEALLVSKTNIIRPIIDEKTGKTYYINKLPIFTSADFIAGVPVLAKDRIHCKLKLRLDVNGFGRIHEIAYYRKGLKAVVTIDGFFAGLTEFEIVEGEEDTIITTEALWNRTEAKLIAEQIPENYKIKGFKARRFQGVPFM